jgi:hypothetical protein
MAPTWIRKSKKKKKKGIKGGGDEFTKFLGEIGVQHGLPKYAFEDETIMQLLEL